MPNNSFTIALAPANEIKPWLARADSYALALKAAAQSQTRTSGHL